MNVVKEINSINERELEIGGSGGSWHDEYKDSAYIFVGGLHYDLTEGDVITIFSQYGEVMDINLPRNKETGKLRGFGFLMYEDQRSTILAVDNLNGAVVLDRTLRVDHVKNYKQKEQVDGEWRDREEQSLNAKPELIYDDNESDASSVSSAPSIDPEDPMRSYLIQKRKEEKAKKKSKKSKKSKRADETPEERQARKAAKREKKRKAAEEAHRKPRAIEDSDRRDRYGSRSGDYKIRSRSRSRSPYRRDDRRRSRSAERDRANDDRRRGSERREDDRYRR